MTRINVVDPSELCDQHLLIEHRELTRIPNDVVKRNGILPLSSEQSYLLGPGHVTFFRDKLLFLKNRYEAIHEECIKRGFNVTNRWPSEVEKYTHLWNDYHATYDDLLLNCNRLTEKLPKTPRYTKYVDGDI